MQIINASHWYCIENIETTTYYVNAPVPFNHQCAESYVPFAWLSINKQTKSIVAARDHFGQEPFYYTIQNQSLIFGSSIPDLLIYLKQYPALSKHCMNDILQTKTVCRIYTTETYHEGIFFVIPGHFLYIEQERCTEKPFWQLCKTPLVYTDHREYFAHFSFLLEEADRKCEDESQPFAL